MSTDIKDAPTTVNPRLLPPYHIILMDDDDHTYGYVIRMLQELFKMTQEEAYQTAEQVDTRGRAILDTTTKELAELRQEQIHGYGRDDLITKCAGSMTCVIEPT